MELVIIGIGLLVFLAHFFTALFRKTRIPDVAPLVAIGLLVGPIFGFVPIESFGKVGGIFTSLALVIILFQGGLGLNFSALKTSLRDGARLTLLNFAASIAAAAPLARIFLGLSWMESIMLGAILGGTSSAVVIPMLSHLKMEERSKTSLFLESAFSDVLCIVVTLALLESIREGDLRPGLMLGQIISSFTLASVIGAAGAFFWSGMLARVRELENSLFMTPAFVCVVFGFSELLGFSGAISALAFGIVLGNIDLLKSFELPGPLARLKPIEISPAEEALFSELGFLLKTFFFVYIGLSVRFNDAVSALTGAAVTAALFIVRIPVVRLSFPPETPRSDAALASVLVPKGLAAAVLASLPAQAGLARGLDIQDAVYAVVLFSIASTTILSFLIENGRLTGFYGALWSRPSLEERS